MDLSYIGKKIKNRRKELGLTQLRIRDLTGISNGNLSDIENGKIAPSAQALIALSNVLKCSTDYLLFDNLSISDNFENNLSEEENHLINIFRSLDKQSQTELLDFAQYKEFTAFKNSTRKYDQEILSSSVEKNDVAGTA